MSRIALVLTLAFCGHLAAQDLHLVRTWSGTTAEGSMTGFGTITASAGDIDRDGCDDIIVGRPFADSSAGADAGSATVYSGRTGAVLHHLEGQSAQEKFGRAVASVGDVNGDDHPDFAVGWNFEDTFSAGGVRVYSGVAGALIGELTGFSLYGDAIAPLDDVDGDGRDEFLIGVPLYSSLAAFQSGKVDIVEFDPALGFVVMATIDGSQAQARFGQALARVGDVDSDGVADFVVGEPCFDTSIPTHVDGGRAYLYSGATRAVITTRNGTGTNQEFGRVVAGGGDVNGDGVPDWGGGTAGGEMRIVSGLGGFTLYNFVDLFGTQQGLGRGLAILDDVDGDGYAEFATGAPLVDVAGTDSGRVTVFSGFDGSLLHDLHGDASGDEFGETLAAADVDGDGLLDLVVGAPFVDTGFVPFINANVGAFSVYAFGDGATHAAGGSFCTSSRVAGLGDVDGDGVGDYATGSPCDVVSTMHPEPVRVYSGATRQLIHSIFYFNVMGLFGHDLDGIGDVDGDGASDIVVGNPGLAGGAIDAGEVRVFSGATGQELTALVRSGQGSDRLGFSVAGVGDVDGDGVPDFAAGSPEWDRLVIISGLPVLRLDAGKVEVFSGANGAKILTIVGPSSGARMGHSIDGLGDVDGDGVPDLAIGIPGDSSGTGSVEIRSGADGSLIRSRTGTLSGEALGTSVACAGDVDRDGVNDVVAGAPLGGLFASGRVRVFSGASGAILLDVAGTDSGDHLGEAVAGAGDVDGDGHCDVIAGAPDADGSGLSSRGAALVFSGATGMLLAEHAGEDALDRFGSSVAGPGDLDRDCRGDLLVGMSNDGSAIADARISVFLSGGPLGAVPYGAGSPGCDGAVCLGVSNPPVVGSSDFGFLCTGVPPLTSGIIVFAGSSAYIDPGADPFNLGLLFHLDLLDPSLAATTMSSDLTGFAFLPVPLPNIPAIAGFDLVLQVIWSFGPCLSIGFGYGTSNGLALTLLP